MAKGKRMKLQWRRYKLGTIGMIVIAGIAAFLLYSGILAVSGGSDFGYLLILLGLIFFVGVGFDLYRMYGY